jgi:O-glycosyl hydrolase
MAVGTTTLRAVLPEGSFEVQDVGATVVGPWLKAAGDLNGDGRCDLIVGGAEGGGLVAYFNDYPRWRREVIDGTRRFSTDGEVADVDGDGRNDVVAITHKPASVVWYQNTPGGWSMRPIATNTWHDVEVADLDGDTLLDVAGRNQKEWPAGKDAGNSLYICWQRRAGTNVTWEQTTLDCPPGEGLLVTDADGDGDPDLVINQRWYENLGGRRFTQRDYATDAAWNHSNTFIAASDFNGDGRRDLVVSPSELQGQRYKVAWFEAPPDPRSSPWVEHLIVTNVETVLHFVGAADFDEDGRTDIATAHMPQGADPDDVAIYFNRGTQRGGFWVDEWVPQVLSVDGSHSMRILDADGDGRPDLFGANWRAHNRDERVKLWLNRLATPAHGAGVLRVNIDSAKACQTMDGFGASDAWQCDIVGRNWPLAKRERIADLLFSREADAHGNPKGIGLSIWRFNIGAGTAEQGEGSGITNPWRRAECFQTTNGTYDWTRQAGQQWFLRAARQRGVEKFLAFPNAPPVHLSSNGKGYAPKGSPHLNLAPGKMDEYAAFLGEVIEHFEKAGLPFDYLSPVNEPQWNWDEAKQEGTPALNEEIYALVRSLSRRLSGSGLKTRMVIGEAATIGHAAMTMNLQGQTSDGRDDQARFFFNLHSPFYIGGLPNVELILSAHSYFSVWPLDKQVEHRQKLREAIQAANPKLGYWQSEYCILEENGEIRGGRRRDLGMNTALYVARIIHHDLTVAHAKSWQWWTAVSQVDFKDGLVYLDDGSQGETGSMGPKTLSLMQDGTVRESKLLWVLGNYSRFVRPGMVRIECEIGPAQSYVDGVLASAYRGADGDIVLVLVNLSQQEVLCDLGSGKTVDVYTTSASSNLEKSHQEASNVKVPARAVSTLILR